VTAYVCDICDCVGLIRRPRQVFGDGVRVVEPVPGLEQEQPEELVELVGKAADDLLGIVDHVLVGDQSELHSAVVGEDADAHADVAGLRYPDHLLVDPAAGEVAGLLRPGRWSSPPWSCWSAG
jgi:hypothetical protein